MPIRPMTIHDVPQVNAILSKAFTQARTDEGYREARVPLAIPRFLEMYLAAFPDGCFVYQTGLRVVGFIFSRVWGRVGWFGPLAVLPEAQGQAIGRQLVQASLAALQAAGAETLGLETSPRNFYNLGFYTHLGFAPGFLAVDLLRACSEVAQRELNAPFRFERFSQISSETKPSFLAQVDGIAHQVERGLLAADEITRLDSFNFGDTALLWRADEPIGFAVAHTEPFYQDEPRRYLKVYLGALRPQSSDQEQAAFVQMLDAWAAWENLQVVVVRVSTRLQAVYNFFIKNRFRVVHSDLRLTLHDFPERSEQSQFYLSKWE